MFFSPVLEHFGTRSSTYLHIRTYRALMSIRPLGVVQSCGPLINVQNDSAPGTEYRGGYRLSPRGGRPVMS